MSIMGEEKVLRDKMPQRFYSHKEKAYVMSKLGAPDIISVGYIEKPKLSTYHMVLN